MQCVPAAVQLPAPKEQLLGSWDGMQLYFHRRLAGTGRLSATSSRLVWTPAGENRILPGVGYAASWKVVGVHAVCRAADDFGMGHVYCQVDTCAEAAEGEEDHRSASEVRFVPADQAEEVCLPLLDEVFSVFSDASSMNPDDISDSAALAMFAGCNPLKRKRAGDDGFTACFEGGELTQEEMQRRMAEWDSKLIVEGEEEEEEDPSESEQAPAATG
eukprot:TRINITY_DN46930_c0_g1_i1.p1 TRINITY_DN46930_c0_g1~~TRINITY_DN46930_c0_g1_i1.p1  ORF type:complete len:237 (+),score=101.11 TRINITY_DN46930_c0_g1_i1:66-713(+)